MSLIDNISNLAIAIRNKINTMTPRLLPSGGITGQVLSKSSNTDYATNWVDQSGGGSGVDESFVVAMSIIFGDK